MHCERRVTECVHTLLVVGRVSNLPTVWSNCLAAWLLAGAGPWAQFAMLSVGATFLYAGGMFLNDAFDVQFDRQFRPERPIAAGKISRKAVWIWSAALLLLGWAAVAVLGTNTAIIGLLLLAGIFTYNWLHKRAKLGIFLMAGCRFLLYLLAASAAQALPAAEIWWRASALALYILSISALARAEYTGTGDAAWWRVVLFVPVIVALWRELPMITTRVWVALAVLTIWITFCLSKPITVPHKDLGRGVAGLLAGVVLVDWLAVAGKAGTPNLVFIGLFGMALVLQRIAPAT